MEANRATTVIQDKKTVQDDAREEMIVKMCGLVKTDSRDGIDAFDELHHPYEIKSTTKRAGVSTARDVGLHTVERWRKQYWVFAIGENLKSGFEIRELFVAHPDHLEPFFQKVIDRFIESTLSSMHTITFARQMGWDADDCNKAWKNMKKGARLNDPNIPLSLVRGLHPLPLQTPDAIHAALLAFTQAHPLPAEFRPSDEDALLARCINQERILSAVASIATPQRKKKARKRNRNRAG